MWNEAIEPTLASIVVSLKTLLYLGCHEVTLSPSILEPEIIFIISMVSLAMCIILFKEVNLKLGLKFCMMRASKCLLTKAKVSLEK